MSNCTNGNTLDRERSKTKGVPRNDQDLQQLGCNRLCSIRSSINMIRMLIRSHKERELGAGTSFAERGEPVYETTRENLEICFKVLRREDKRRAAKIVRRVQHIVDENFEVWKRVFEIERRRLQESSNGNHLEGMSEKEKAKLLSSISLLAVRLFSIGMDPLSINPEELLANRQIITYRCPPLSF